MQTRAVVVFDMKGQLNIHQTIGLPALRDEGVNGPMNCYFRWVDTLATLSDKPIEGNDFPNG